MVRRRRSLLIPFLAVVVALTAVSIASAQESSDTYSERTLRLSRQLECPVCQGQTIAESQSDLAITMRAIVEEKVRAGESDEQILQYFADRYGESVLVNPPKSGVGLGLWWIPPLVLLIGAGVVVAYVREKTVTRPSTSPQTSAPTDDDELESIAREVLGEQRGSERMSAS